MRTEHKPTFDAPTERDLRKRRVNAVISKVFSCLPDHILELNALLRRPSVDVRQSSRIIRNDPTLHVRVLSLASAAVVNDGQPVHSIAEAMVLLGPERLRAFVLSHELTNLAGRQLSEHSVRDFRQHSSLTAAYSERIARGLDYLQPEEAYVGGLIHDIGTMPLLIVAQEEKAKGAAPPQNWQDDLLREREFFGIDHCEVGRWMGVAWDFSSSLVEVIQHHHAPLNSTKESVLVGIVAAGDYYSGLPSAVTAGYRSEVAPLSLPLISGITRAARTSLIS